MGPHLCVRQQQSGCHSWARCQQAQGTWYRGGRVPGGAAICGRWQTACTEAGRLSCPLRVICDTQRALPCAPRHKLGSIGAGSRAVGLPPRPAPPPLAREPLGRGGAALRGAGAASPQRPAREQQRAGRGRRQERETGARRHFPHLPSCARARRRVTAAARGEAR